MPLRNGHRRDEASMPDYDEALLPPEAPKIKLKDGTVITPNWETVQGKNPPEGYEWDEKIHRYTKKKRA